MSRILEETTKKPLKASLIHNPNTGETVTTDERGVFKITAEPSDQLVITMPNQELAEIIPVNEMEEVTYVNQTNKDRDSTQSKSHGQKALASLGWLSLLLAVPFVRRRDVEKTKPKEPLKGPNSKPITQKITI